jgi:uncharacterized protein (DUF697 family)
VGVEEKLEKAKSTVRKYMYWSMGAGFIPVPFLDFAAITGVQIKMLADTGKIYDIPFSRDRVKTLVGALIGGALPGPLAYGALGSTIKLVPVVGPIFGGISVPLMAGATTYAVGTVFIQHFESGGTFLDFDPEKMKEHFKREFEKGKTVAQEMAGKKSEPKVPVTAS